MHWGKNGLQRFICLLFLAVLLATLPRAQTQSLLSRLLNVFTVVSFENEPCIAESTNQTGRCMTSVECTVARGKAVDTCASGFGTCCVQERTCSETADGNHTYFTWSSREGACSLTVPNLPGSCQVRLDFIKFEMRGPTQGDCRLDRFVVTGQNPNGIVPAICGYNTGQHMYVEVWAVSGPLTLTLLTVGEKFPRSLQVLITHIPCNSIDKAPTNCLQYETGLQGTVRSLNYRPDKVLRADIEEGYLNNLRYAICFRRQPDFCALTLTPSNDPGKGNPPENQSFSVDAGQGLPWEEAGVGHQDCPNDYLLVNGNRICGDRVGAEPDLFYNPGQHEQLTDSSPGPLVMSFFSDSKNVRRGFSLRYTQMPCRRR